MEVQVDGGGSVSAACCNTLQFLHLRNPSGAGQDGLIQEVQVAVGASMLQHHLVHLLLRGVTSHISGSGTARAVVEVLQNNTNTSVRYKGKRRYAHPVLSAIQHKGKGSLFMPMYFSVSAL